MSIWIEFEEWLKEQDTAEAEQASEDWARRMQAQVEAMWEAHERSH